MPKSEIDMLKRQHIAALVLSASTLIGIATHEAYREEAYIPVRGDVPTIGFGTTQGVKLGDKIDPVRALIRLQQDADKYAQAVKRCAPVPMHQYEFDAYVSFTYNVGSGAFCSSTIVKLLNAGDYDGACKQLLRWNGVKRNGKKIVLPGLQKRREAEYRTCIGDGEPKE